MKQKSKVIGGLFALLLCAAISSQAQSCFPNGLWLFSQQEIDEFKIFYPNCTVIEGDLNIAAPDATNLNGLSNITDVQGILAIEGCDALTNLNGLQNLETATHFYLAGNSALTNISALANLTAVNGFFFIQENAALSNLNGLQNLHTVGGDCWIHYSPALTDISALNGLTTVGGELGLNFATGIPNLNALSNLQSVGSISFSWNDALTDISGLQNIAQPLDSIAIWGNPNLLSLNGLQQITQVDGPVFILFNEKLSSLTGLEGLATVGGKLTVSGHKNLTSLNALSNLVSVGGSVEVKSNDSLLTLTGLNNLQSIGGDLEINANQSMGNLTGLNGLQSIGGNLKIQANPLLTDLSALQNLVVLGGNLDLNSNYILPNLHGFGNLSTVGGGILIHNNDGLLSLDGLQNISTAGGEVFVSQNDILQNLNGLDGLQQINGAFVVTYNPELTSLSGVQNLETVGSWVYFTRNTKLPDLTGLGGLSSIGDYLLIQQNESLISLKGLEKLGSVGGRLAVLANPVLADINGLNHLTYVGGQFEFQSNDALLNLDSLHLLNTVGGGLSINANFGLLNITGLKNLSALEGPVEIRNNYNLAECSIPPICQRLFNDPASIIIQFNATGCETPEEVEDQCGTTPVFVSVKTDADGDCLPDAANLPVKGGAVWLSAPGQATLRPTDAAGISAFRYFNNGPVFVMPAQFPDANWDVCGADTLEFVPGVSPDTTFFLLIPKNQCPELTVNLGLPSVFSDCSVASPVLVFVKNSGAAPAQGIQVAVVMPPEFDLISAIPAPSGQIGDTLLFQTADLMPLTGAEIRLTVKTKCSGVPVGKALCWSAFATLANGCPVNPSPASAIKLTAECTGAMVRFTLKNIGNAATPAGHEYTIFRNGAGATTMPFSLAAGESTAVEVAADGATWRMEATKSADGALTAVSHEGCGGLTPGWTTAYWQDNGPLAADFDCRQVAALKSHTGKNAFPAGVGPDRLLSPNRPLRYTIDFHNGEAEEINSVSIRDMLPPELDLNAIRPGAASHPYTWEIRKGNVLQVKFDPIQLGDSLGDPAAAHGFFTFEINQQPDLPDGAVLQNVSETFFGNFFPSRDTAWHTISKTGANSQKCLPTIPGFGFYTQEHIDNFPVNYPGCTEIEGDLIIGEFQNDITNLNGFSQLRSVGGSLRISNCEALQSLNGLNNLRSIGQGLGIGNLPLLTDLSGLEKLQSIDSMLLIQGCHGLKSLHGLDSLRKVKFVDVSFNDSLTDLSALGNLPHNLFGLNIGGVSLTSLQGLQHLDSIGAGGLSLSSTGLSQLNDLSQIEYIAGRLDIGYNPALASLAGLSNLGGVGGDLSITANPALTSLAELSSLTGVGGTFTLDYQENMIQPGGPPALKTIGGNLWVQGMPQLTNLGGLASLDSIGGSLRLANNPNQITASGLPALRQVGNIEIYGTAMQDLTGLDSIRNVPGFVQISYMPELRDFQGLGQLETIGGRLEVAYNQALINFDGLGTLTTIGENFTVYENTALENFAGLTGLRDIGNQAYFYNNAVLNNFAGLDGLQKIGDSLVIFSNPALTSLEGFTVLDTIADDLWLHDNPALTSFGSFDQLRYIGEDFDLGGNQGLINTIGLERLEYIGGNFSLGGNSLNSNNITSLEGLSSLAYVGGDFLLNPDNGVEGIQLSNLNGLEKLAYIGGNLPLIYAPALSSLAGLKSLETVGGDFRLNGLLQLTSLHGLENLTSIGGGFELQYCPGVTSLTGLNNLKNIGDYLGVDQTLPSFKGLEKLERIGGNFTADLWYIKDFNGLNSLNTIGGYFRIAYNQALETLHGLESLTTVGNDFRIDNNPKLLTLDGLNSLDSVGGAEFWVLDNPLLSDCDIYFICNKYFTNNSNPFVATFNNAPGCDAWWEVQAACNSIPVHATVLIDQNGDCLPDAGDIPVEDVQVQLSGGNGQAYLRGSDAGGAVQFRYFNNGPFTLRLPHFPSVHWNVCQADTTFTPGNGPLPDTIEVAMLLRPGQLDCPQLEVTLGLPSELHNCLVVQDMNVSVKNTGSTVAEAVQVAVAKPLEIEVLTTDPPVVAQAGDTLYFDLGDINPLVASSVKIRFRTNCNYFLLHRTLCFEASAHTLLPCPTTPVAFSEIKIFPQCVGDTIVRFTLKNIGDAPTAAPHRYMVYQNTTPVDTVDFSLAAQESLTLDLPANGSTYRIEATKRNDGSLAAAALEHCGGFTEFMINAFWLDKGPLEYDFDCREVVGSFDPNQKTAVPVGAGQAHFLEAGYPLIYTIDFQNTGNDTARRVLLRDILPPHLDVNTFRPLFSSHPNTWEIRGSDTLEVLFFPISLPDSNVNEPASHGFFSFTIAQKLDLPDGTLIENTADIIFDFNPPIITNTVWHTIGKLLVRTYEPASGKPLWRVLGNPTRDEATFEAAEPVEGDKFFELFDAAGRPVYRRQFAGQTFEFRRDGLPAGWYVFRISDDRGRRFAGSIVVTD